MKGALGQLPGWVKGLKAAINKDTQPSVALSEAELLLNGKSRTKHQPKSAFMVAQIHCRAT
jgi:hypothetical protein